MKLEKAKEQEDLLEASAKELAERHAREKELQKLIEEREVGGVFCFLLLLWWNDILFGYHSKKELILKKSMQVYKKKLLAKQKNSRKFGQC